MPVALVGVLPCGRMRARPAEEAEPGAVVAPGAEAKGDAKGLVDET